MNILLVGRHGQLAQALQQALADHEVVALGHEALDLADAPLIRDTVRRLQPELIVNAAAYTAVDRAETERAQAFAINAAGPGVLAEEAARLGIALVHYSTDYVFDGCRDGRYDEGDAPNPLNVYGASKLAGEQAIQAVGGAHLILRTSWVYSQHGHNFLLTMQRLLLERDGLSVVCDEIGAPTWARTIALATAHMIHRLRDGTGGPFGLYHLTARGETSWFASPARSPATCSSGVMRPAGSHRSAALNTPRSPCGR